MHTFHTYNDDGTSRSNPAQHRCVTHFSSNALLSEAKLSISRLAGQLSTINHQLLLFSASKRPSINHQPSTII
jgi:hypothetical protein